MRYDALLAMLLAAYTVGAARAAAADDREGVLRSAIHRWTFGARPPALEPSGDVTFGVNAEGDRASAGARVASFAGGYLRAVNAGNVRGSAVTVYLRARDPRGVWNWALLSKRGSGATINFNLFSADLPGTPGADIGFEIHTERGLGSVSFPVSRIDPSAWHDLAGRYDGRILEILCDGRVMDRRLFGGTLTENREPVLIGAETDDGHVVRPLHGEIQDAAIWDRAVSDRDLARLMRTDNILRGAELPSMFVSPIHYRPNPGALADTIPFFWNGEYHVFYLLANLGGTPWAHIVSRDLIHWRDLPIALPLGKRGDPDGENVFTGSVIQARGAFHIFYTGFNTGHPGGREQIMHATSPDLISWTKHPGETFRADGIRYRNLRGEDFRDAFVYQVADTGRYRMLLCARDGVTGAPVTGVAESEDLVAWRQREPLARNWPDTPECPDLFRIGERWYLLASPPNHGVTEVRVAPSEDGPWTEPEGPAMDTPILYAAKRMYDGRRHVLVGWLRDLEGDKDSGAHRWGGDQCLPRELYADASGRLCSRPVPAASAQFRKRVYDLRTGAAPREMAGHWTRAASGWRSEPAGGSARIRIGAPDHYMLRCKVDLAAGAALGVRFRVPDVGDGGYRLLVRPAGNLVSLSSPAFRYERHCPLDDKGGSVDVQAFVQGTIIECFVDGAFAYSCRAYDFRSGALELETVGGSGTIRDLAIAVSE